MDKIKFTLLPGAKQPVRAHLTDAGLDLFAYEDSKIGPFERKIIRTGVSISLPSGVYARVAPRSGLAVKAGLDVLAGVIDQGFLGEIGVVLINLNTIEFLSHLFRIQSGGSPGEAAFSNLFGAPGEFQIKKGDRIALYA